MISIDNILRVLAPHLCIVCGREASVKCESCLETAGEPMISRCTGCHKLSGGLENKSLLGRRTNVRQLESTRTKRLEQMEQEFYAKDPESINGKYILLVDNVVSTGASLSGAATILKKAGASQVSAVVFAQKL